MENSVFMVFRIMDSCVSPHQMDPQKVSFLDPFLVHFGPILGTLEGHKLLIPGPYSAYPASGGPSKDTHIWCPFWTLQNTHFGCKKGVFGWKVAARRVFSLSGL